MPLFILILEQKWLPEKNEVKVPEKPEEWRREKLKSALLNTIENSLQALIEKEPKEKEILDQLEIILKSLKSVDD